MTFTQKQHQEEVATLDTDATLVEAQKAGGDTQAHVNISAHTAPAIQISWFDSKTPECKQVRVRFADILQPHLCCFDSMP